MFQLIFVIAYSEFNISCTELTLLYKYSYLYIMIVEELITAKTEPEVDFIKPEIDFKDNYIVCSGCNYGIHEEFILKVNYLKIKYNYC